jgi:glycosyltransferase involved in cell wall biosynthesis
MLSSRRSGPLDRYRGHRHLQALQRADHLLATSQANAARVLRLTGRVATVLHPPIDPALQPPDLHLGAPRAPRWPYLLTVAGTAKTDRRDLALTAWAGLRRTPALDGASLVVVGPPLTDEEEAMVTGCGGHVDVVTDPSDDDLRELYAGTEALLCLGEPGGFDWPIVEAHAAGRPVLATDAESFQEIGADACIYLPTDLLSKFHPQIWAELAEDLCSPVLTTRALANALRFGWDSFVQRLPAAATPPAGAQSRRALALPRTVPQPRVADPAGVVRTIDLTDDLTVARPLSRAGGRSRVSGSRPGSGR